MTEPDIRDLLAELVEPMDAPEVAGHTWDQMLRQRSHRRMAIGAGAAASVLAIGGGAAYLRAHDGRAEPTRMGPAVTNPPTSEAPTLGSYRVWKAPSIDDEATAARIDSTLPDSIDLSAPNPSVQEAPIDRAVAAFGIVKIVGNSTRFDGVMLVTSDGELRHLDAVQLEEIPNPTGDPFLPFSAGSLSPDGTQLAFEQRSHGDAAVVTVEIFDLATARWSTYEVGEVMDPYEPLSWSQDGSGVRVGLWTLNVASGQATRDRIGSPLYPPGIGVESWWGAERVEGDNHARGATYLNESALPVNGVDSHPPAVVVAGGLQALLLIPDQQPRWKYCCAVAGWLDPRTVAYESRFGSIASGQTIRILAWDIIDGRVGLVSTVTGSRDMQFVGSYADLSS